MWCSVGGHDVYPLILPQTLRALARNLPLHPVKGVRQALGIANYTFAFRPLTLTEAMVGRQNHLFDNRPLQRFLRRSLPIENLEDARLPLSILASEVRSGKAVALSCGPAVPALLASTAIPALFPNVTIGEQVLMDGGVAERTTLDLAVEQGADEVYLLSPGFCCDLPVPPSTAITMALHAYNLLSEQRIAASIRCVEHRTRLRLVPPLYPAQVLPIDFGQTRDLIERATETTREWIAHNVPVPDSARHAADHAAASPVRSEPAG
ncbi:patatin-like phospholipase family protein [Actinomadura rugatobispora]|uniref:Patatin-like phospholipase family protein n=1 Tax=Actinomadura rugatobispora TaxID=1994 RepID=A0ABW0ZXN0_9ACTN|nr:hypothetical protein GCM10010200_097220 [Actinomadura rugatobispora]